MAPFSKEQLLALLQDDRTRLKLAGPNVAALAELAAPNAVREPAVETATPAPVVQPVASKPRLDELVGIPTQSPQDDLEAQLRKYLQLQQSGVEENQAALKNYLAQEPRVDWAPLIALADAETGSNILRGYTRPPSPEERAKTEQELRGLINRQQAGLTDDMINLYNAKMQREYLKSVRENANNDRAAARDEAREYKKEMGMERDVQKLGDDLKSPQDIISGIKSVEEELGFRLDDATVTDDNKLIVNGNEFDLPGVNIPGVGRFEAYSTKAQNLRTAMSKIFNAELKDKSGTAVTDKELARLKQQFAEGRFNTEPQMIGALKAYQKRLGEVMQGREAKYRPEVLERYRGRDGLTSKDAFSKRQTPRETSTNISPEDQAAIEWALANPKDPSAATILKLNGVK